MIVPDDQLSLAIGRDGQNARLAARLTGWRVDIKSETEFAQEDEEIEYEGEEQSDGRCMAVLSNGRRCPNAAIAELAPTAACPQHQALARFETNQVAVLGAVSRGRGRDPRRPRRRRGPGRRDRRAGRGRVRRGGRGRGGGRRGVEDGRGPSPRRPSSRPTDEARRARTPRPSRGGAEEELEASAEAAEEAADEAGAEAAGEEPRRAPRSEEVEPTERRARPSRSPRRLSRPSGEEARSRDREGQG